MQASQQPTTGSHPNYNSEVHHNSLTSQTSLGLDDAKLYLEKAKGFMPGWRPEDRVKNIHKVVTETKKQQMESKSKQFQSMDNRVAHESLNQRVRTRKTRQQSLTDTLKHTQVIGDSLEKARYSLEYHQPPQLDETTIDDSNDIKLPDINSISYTEFQPVKHSNTLLQGTDQTIKANKTQRKQQLLKSIHWQQKSDFQNRVKQHFPVKKVINYEKEKREGIRDSIEKKRLVKLEELNALVRFGKQQDPDLMRAQKFRGDQSLEIKYKQDIQKATDHYYKWKYDISSSKKEKRQEQLKNELQKAIREQDNNDKVDSIVKELNSFAQIPEHKAEVHVRVAEGMSGQRKKKFLEFCEEARLKEMQANIKNLKWRLPQFKDHRMDQLYKMAIDDLGSTSKFYQETEDLRREQAYYEDLVKSQKYITWKERQNMKLLKPLAYKLRLKVVEEFLTLFLARSDAIRKRQQKKNSLKAMTRNSSLPNHHSAAPHCTCNPLALSMQLQLQSMKQESPNHQRNASLGLHKSHYQTGSYQKQHPSAEQTLETGSKNHQQSVQRSQDSEVYGNNENSNERPSKRRRVKKGSQFNKSQVLIDLIQQTSTDKQCPVHPTKNVTKTQARANAQSFVTPIKQMPQQLKSQAQSSQISPAPCRHYSLENLSIPVQRSSISIDIQSSTIDVNDSVQPLVRDFAIQSEDYTAEINHEENSQGTIGEVQLKDSQLFGLQPQLNEEASVGFDDEHHHEKDELRPTTQHILNEVKIFNDAQDSVKLKEALRDQEKDLETYEKSLQKSQQQQKEILKQLDQSPRRFYKSIIDGRLSSEKVKNAASPTKSTDVKITLIPAESETVNRLTTQVNSSLRKAGLDPKFRRICKRANQQS